MIKPALKGILPGPFWLTMSGMRWSIERDDRLWKSMLDLVGRDAALALWPEFDRRGRAPHGARAGRKFRRLRLKGFDHPLEYRPDSSDLSVVRQVFFDRQYECIAGERDVRLIVDCGANIGCASFYLLQRYPDAHVIAIEPDPENFSLCRRNLAPFGTRVTLVNSGLWSEPASLVLVRDDPGDRQEWAIRVRRAAPGETPDLVATTIDRLLDDSPFDTIDILKVDVEGSEVELFSGADRWLPRTRNLAIELHDSECVRAFDRAMSGFESEQSQHGEILLCKDLRTVEGAQ